MMRIVAVGYATFRGRLRIVRIAMRKHILVLITLASVFIWADVCNAQDAGKIVEQYVKAVGGSKLLGSLQTISVDGTISGGDARGGTYSWRVKQPNRYYS